jgi:PAS domain S-box-containing protein
LGHQDGQSRRGAPAPGPRAEPDDAQGPAANQRLDEVIRFLDELTNLRAQLACATPLGFTITRAINARDHHIVYASPGFETLTGYSLAEVLNRDCRLLQRGDRHQPGRAVLREAIARRQEATATLRNYRKNGELFWNEVFIAPLRGALEDEALFLGVQHDVTQRQHTLQWLNTNCDAATSLKHTLGEQDRYKSEFLTVVNHELRTPLQAILGFTELLSDWLPENNNPLLRQCVTGLRNETVRLQRQVDNLLSMSQIVTGTLNIQPAPINYAALLQEVVEDLRSLAEQKRLSIHTQLTVPPELPLDGSALQKVLLNLLDNAIKFSPPGPERIRIQARVADHRLITTIHNPGCSLSDEARARLFQPFSQGDMTIRRPQGGLGLGLCLSRALVEGHGGRLRLQAPPGGGFTVSLVIPL